MTDQVVSNQAIDFSLRDREAVKLWLQDKPHSWAIVLSARSALRVMPAVFGLNRDRLAAVDRDALTLGCLYAVALPLAAAKYQNLGDDPRFRLAAVSAARSADRAALSSILSSESAVLSAARAADSAGRAADTAARARDAADSAVNSAESAAAAAAAAAEATDRGFPNARTILRAQVLSAAKAEGPARSSAWRSFSQDVHFLAQGGSAEDLARRPLWTLSETEKIQVEKHGLRKLFMRQWVNTSSALNASPSEAWHVWTEWYDALIDGRSDFWPREAYEVLLRPEIIDAKDPAVVNRAIIEAIEAKKTPSSDIPPILPEPGPGPTITETNGKADIELLRSPQRPFSKRSETLLDELREAARDFIGAFDPQQNVHPKIRGVAERYLKHIELENPDVNVIFSLGLRLENAALADFEQQKVADRSEREPEFTAEQREALKSTVDLHAVFIATDPEGQELLAAAERYAYRAAEEAVIKKTNEEIVDLAKALTTERLNEFMTSAVAQMGQAPDPARSGVIARNTMQRVLLYFAKTAITALLGATLVRTAPGQAAIQIAVPLAQQAIDFFLANTEPLRVLAAHAREGFGFLEPLIDYIKRKTGRDE
jgi:hypothetical protein